MSVSKLGSKLGKNRNICYIYFSTYKKTAIPIQKSNTLSNFWRSFSEFKQNGNLRIRIGSNKKFPFPKLRLNCAQDLRVWGSLKYISQLSDAVSKLSIRVDFPFQGTYITIEISALKTKVLKELIGYLE